MDQKYVKDGPYMLCVNNHHSSHSC